MTICLTLYLPSMGLPLSCIHVPDEAAGPQRRTTEQCNTIVPAEVAEDEALREVGWLEDATHALRAAFEQHRQNGKVSPRAAEDISERMQLIQDRLFDLSVTVDHTVIHTEHRSCTGGLTEQVRQ